MVDVNISRAEDATRKVEAALRYQTENNKELEGSLFKSRLLNVFLVITVIASGLALHNKIEENERCQVLIK